MNLQMKKSLLLFPFLIGSAYANDHSFGPRKSALNAIKVAAYGVPTVSTLHRGHQFLLACGAVGIDPQNNEQPFHWIGLAEKDITRILLLEHGLPMLITASKTIRNEKRVFMGNETIPAITDHDIGDTIIAGTSAALVTAIADGGFSPSRMARAAGKAAAIQFVENKIIDAAQVVNDRFHLLDQNGLGGAALAGIGRFAAQNIASMAVRPFIMWPLVDCNSRR